MRWFSFFRGPALEAELEDTRRRLLLVQDREHKLSAENEALKEERDHLREELYEHYRKVTDYFAVSSTGRSVYDPNRTIPLPNVEARPAPMRRRRDRPSVDLGDMLRREVEAMSDGFDAGLESIARANTE